MRFLKVGCQDYQGVVLNSAEQESLLADLGGGEALILRNHGALTVGNSVGEAFNWMHRLELACRSQLAAMAANSPLARVPEQVLQETWNNYQPGTRRPYGVMEWPALLRKRDRIGGDVASALGRRAFEPVVAAQTHGNEPANCAPPAATSLP